MLHCELILDTTAPEPAFLSFMERYRQLCDVFTRPSSVESKGGRIRCVCELNAYGDVIQEKTER